jgi:hypothetical protein
MEDKCSKIDSKMPVYFRAKTDKKKGATKKAGAAVEDEHLLCPL